MNDVLPGPAKPAKQRDIIDRLALYERLMALAEKGEPQRKDVAAILKETLQAGQAEVRARFDAGASGTEVVRGLSFLVDQTVRALFDFTTTAVYRLANPTAAEHIARKRGKLRKKQHPEEPHP